MNAAPPIAVDAAVIRQHVEIIHSAAAHALNGAPQPGVLQLVCIHPDIDGTLSFPFDIGAVEEMTEEAIRQAKAFRNVYIEARTITATGKGRGKSSATRGVFGFVIDADADKGRGSSSTVPPSLVVETSPGNGHHWFFLDRALPPDEAKPIGAAIRAAAGADSDTGVITQPYRVAGTPNYPDRKKRERGRVVTPTRMLGGTGHAWTLDELRVAFPAPERPKAERAKPRPEGTSGRTSTTAEDLASQTDAIDRSSLFFEAVEAAFADGLTVDDLEDLMRRHPEGCAEKYLAPYDRLRVEIERVWEKLEVKAAGARLTQAEPTHPDNRQTVADAERETAALIDAFFSENVPAYRTLKLAWDAEIEEWKTLKADRDPDLPEAPPVPVPTSWGARVETAIGKTEMAIQAAAKAAKEGFHIVYSTPMHMLLTEVAERFRALDIEVRVYRGYYRPDPDMLGSNMCLDLAAVQDALDAGLHIRPSVCQYKKDGLEYRCAFIDACGMERQRNAKPKIWLVPHALLFQSKPTFIPHPNAIVIDESIVMAAIPDKPACMSVDTIRAADIALADEVLAFSPGARDLELARCNLLRALDAHPGDGPLQRDILLRHGVTGAVAGSARTLEWRRMRNPGIYPGMKAKDRKPLVAGIGRHNAEAKRLSGIWAEVSDFLKGEAETSGRLMLRYDEEAECRILEHRSLGTVEASWSAPSLLIDATLPDAALIEPVIGHTVEVRADITARWSKHVRVRQILGAPVSASKLGIVEGKRSEAPRRAIHHLLRFIRLRAALAWPRTVVVIAPKRLIELFDTLGLPENVETGHFGAIAGIDRWRTAAWSICIGRLQPGPSVIEAMAGVVTGRVPQTVPPGAHGGTWYPKVEGGVRLASGEGVRVEVERHPDPIVEALRAQVTEGGLIQAIGRLRPLRRTAETTASLDIVSDVPLPISVDETAPWSEALPGSWTDMAPVGVLLESPADIMRAFQDLAPTRKAAREHTVTAVALTSIKNLSIEVGASPVTVCRYKRRGHEPASCYLLPNRPADVYGWMAERLKGLEWLKIEGEERQRPAAGSPDADGIALDSAADMAVVWPHLWPSFGAARAWRSRNGGSALDGAATRFRYQRQGRNQKWRSGAYDPAIVADARAWLTDRLGPLAGFELVEAVAEPSSPAAPSQHDCAPFPCAVDIDPGLAATYRCAVDAPAAANSLASVIPEPARFDPAVGIVFPAAILDRLECIRLAETAAANRSVKVNEGRPRQARMGREAAVR